MERLNRKQKGYKRKQIIQLQHLKKTLLFLCSLHYDLIVCDLMTNLTDKSKKISRQKKRNANSRVPMRPPTAALLLQVFTHLLKLKFCFFFHSIYFTPQKSGHLVITKFIRAKCCFIFKYEHLNMNNNYWPYFKFHHSP